VQTVLVTGGAGFIGSNFVRCLIADGKEEVALMVLDALTYAGNLANIQDLIDSRSITFVRGDICDRSVLTRLFETHRFDAVVHFAAESHVDRSILGPQQFIETNVNGTFNLLLTARDCWHGNYEGKRFLHVSTDEVFGTLSPSDPPFSEKTPYAPNSPYSASKAASDHLVRAWHHTYGFPAIVTNCSNNYGPWQFPEKLIPLMILSAAEERNLPVYGDGMQIRDWLHVVDHCEAVRLVLEKGRVGETYCIGGDNELANITIVERICDLIDERTGRQPGASRRLIRHVEDRPGHDRRYAIDAGKIRAELGWRPRLAFESALADVVDWYLENRAWVETIRSGEYLRFYEDQYGGRLRRVVS
jgi:dTDP-glucose 4,6-dehydratase